MKVLMTMAQNGQTNKSFNNKSNNSNPAFKSKLTGEFPKLECDLNIYLNLYKETLTKCEKTAESVQMTMMYHPNINDTHKQAFKNHFDTSKALSDLTKNTIQRITKVLDKMMALKKDRIKRTIELKSGNDSSDILVDGVKKRTIYAADCGPHNLLKDILAGEDIKLSEFFDELLSQPPFAF